MGGPVEGAREESVVGAGVVGMETALQKVSGDEEESTGSACLGFPWLGGRWSHC